MNYSDKVPGKRKKVAPAVSGNVLTAAYAMDGKTAKAKKPRKRKNEDIDGRPLVVIEPPAPSVDPSAALKGKRKKKVPECPNPLFLGWLEEWKSEARAKENTNLSYVYSKAVKSLKKYPAVMDSGRSCAILENFGPKICKMLDERLAEHHAWLAENEERGVGAVVSDAPSTSGGNVPSHVGSSASSTSIGSSSSNPASSSSSQSSWTTASSVAPPSAPAAKKPRRDPSTPRNNRDYIPVRRSGAYAVLVALHQALPTRPFLSKKQLMAEAEPHCDASFQKTDPDSYYSAWSSMKTLLAKELVKKESCPAKFSLTEAGVTLALRLANADESFSQVESNAAPGMAGMSPERRDKGPANNGVTSVSDRGRKYHDISRLISSDDDEDDFPPSTSHPATIKNIVAVPTFPASSPPLIADINRNNQATASSNLSGAFPFTYLDYDHNEVSDKDSSAVTFDSIVQAGFLVKCRQKDLIASQMKYSPFEDDARRRSLSGCREGFILAYLANDDCPEKAPGLRKGGDEPGSEAMKETNHDGAAAKICDESSLSPPQLCAVKKKKKKKRKVSGNTSINISFDDVLMDSGDELPSAGPVKPTRDKANSDFKIVKKSSAPSASDANLVPREVPFPSAKPGPSEYVAKERPLLTKAKGHQRRKSVQDALEAMVASPQSKRTSTSAPLFTLKPGTFQVHLIVDVSEVSGGPSSGGGMRKDATLPELNKTGVSYMTRRLAVGDFVWVGRENVSPHREVVLDYIIERKRMDDLASSIVDGRFREQKYRLKQSGLGHVIYLIEEYGHKTFGNGTLPEASLRQSISNVQIIDDFHVVHCKDPKDVVGYLSIMTQYLRSLYVNKTLHAVPHATFACDVKLSLDDPVQHVFTFEEFGRVAEKNKDLSVRELFAKQLMVLAGISADRSYSIVEHFPTPETLMREYDQLGSVKEKEEMLRDLKCGLTQRKLGPAISKMLSQLYCQKGLLK